MEAALGMLGKLEAMDEAKHSAGIGRQLSEEDLSMSKAALETVGKLEAMDEAKHPDGIGRQLSDEDLSKS